VNNHSYKLPRWKTPVVEEWAPGSWHCSAPNPSDKYGVKWSGWTQGPEHGQKIFAQNSFISALALESCIETPDKVRQDFSAVDQDTADSVPFESVFDGEFGGDNSGYSIRSFESHPEMQSARDREMYAPQRSLHNLDLEKRSRGSLRAAARHDPDEFRKALPADILDRLLVADGDDVPNGAPVRHPSLAPSWPRPELPSWFFDMRQDADVDDLPEPVPVADPGNGKFTVAPRVKHTVSLGLAIGDAEIAAQGEIPVVTIHGVKIGLRRSDKPTPKLPVWSEPYRPESGKGRKVTDPFKQMAICAALGTVPSFLAGITLPAI
jgi:hypothetical protein